jgi:hypothetical protein
MLGHPQAQGVALLYPLSEVMVERHLLHLVLR